VLLIALGDATKGDEGLGAALLRRCREQPIAGRWWLSLIGDAQLQIEHAVDLQINDLAVFIEASADIATPFEFAPVARPDGHRLVTPGETLTPSEVLHTLWTIGQRESLPHCYRLSIQGHSFLQKKGISSQAQEHLDAATAFVLKLLDEPDPERWNAQVHDGHETAVSLNA